jgi:hypothetical protein
MFALKLANFSVELSAMNFSLELSHISGSQGRRRKRKSRNACLAAG